MDFEPMVITGERTVPGIWHENYWFRRHQVVYAALTDAVAGRRVLEAGCGEGYGASMLAEHAASVCALDYDAYTVEHVGGSYPALDVVRANLVSLPFADASFDTVVSLQTVEHLWDQDAFVAECVRVLRPGGSLTLSTPNTLTFPPGNPYHPHELTPDELRALVSRGATVTSMVGLRHGPALATWEAEHGSIVDAQLASDYDVWPAHVRERVRAVTCADFALERPSDDCLDLVVTATA
ncbi:class I SAM-dependent methyltransferase [Solicola gregarius]|uniref:Class I SAM-dependent methyltransferase n=1 Tax=Solicola gregarius TaxID=2908642 RepID=A0AA46YLV3_9ACTN|nr:class I SAM-dependent methyltransferase [Solicola gregarius]UYM05891.1 class I SAM-dependent methyltransferase [Solicola gregarius]